MEAILSQLQQIEFEALRDLEPIQKEEALQAWQTRYLGRSAPLAQVFNQIGSLPREARPVVGEQANRVRQHLEAAFAARRQQLKEADLQARLLAERLDVTLPGRLPAQGRLHPATQTLREIIRIFNEMGFQVFRTPEVESEAYNFELLNIPPYHPARDLWDTFYTTTPGVLLRTHTSPGQVRVMRARAPEPIRVILPGMCYRYEQISARSEIQFNQVEVLAVGREISLANLKGTLIDFVNRLFGPGTRTRFRPSYFPFTEPSAEMDVECFICGGKGCSVCKGTGWLEILGCGMVHPVVLQNGGYDPREFSGFAAGLGPERIAMLRHRIDDIRSFWGNDLRFLNQF